MISLLLPFALMASSPEAPRTAVAEPAVGNPAVHPTRPTLPVITKDEHLFETFGGTPGLTSLMDDAMARWMQNPHTRPFFARADRDRVKALLVQQFCVIMAGPCQYSGRTMAEAHHGMNVDEGAFYALVEELQVAMNKHHIPFPAQNRLIAALAPMHHDIIDK